MYYYMERLWEYGGDVIKYKIKMLSKNYRDNGKNNINVLNNKWNGFTITNGTQIW